MGDKANDRRPPFLLMESHAGHAPAPPLLSAWLTLNIIQDIQGVEVYISGSPRELVRSLIQNPWLPVSQRPGMSQDTGNIKVNQTLSVPSKNLQTNTQTALQKRMWTTVHLCMLNWQHGLSVALLLIVVQLLSRVQFFVTPRNAARQASLSFTISQSLLNLMSTESVMPSNRLILGRPLLLLPSIFPSIRVFSSELVLHIRWPKYWSFSLSISRSSEYSGLISFRMDWLDLLAVQGTLKSLLQYHSSKASILWCSAFFFFPHLFLLVGG